MRDDHFRFGRTMAATAAALLLAAVAAVTLQLQPAHSEPEERYDSWELLPPEFPSTGGGGVIIKGYDPVVRDGKCATRFTAHMPDGAVYANIVEFETEPVQGGILCKNGKWRSADGSAEGTTPLRVFIKDGVRRRSP